LLDIPSQSYEPLFFKEAIQMISVSVIGILIISGKPSGNNLFNKRMADSVLACSMFNSSTSFRKKLLNASAA
jgi:hypothetical protein